MTTNRITRLLVLLELTALVASHQAHAAAVGLKCGGKSAVCAGPLSYQQCVDDLTSGPVVPCALNTRCVTDGLEICVPVKSAAEAPTAAVAKMVTITDSPIVSESAPLVDSTTSGSGVEISTEGAPPSAVPTKPSTPVETTQAPAETTQIPVETTQIPVETMQIPDETIQIPVETTQIPVETTLAPLETTQAPGETTTAAMKRLPLGRKHHWIRNRRCPAIPLPWTPHRHPDRKAFTQPLNPTHQEKIPTILR
ncbi:GM13255 [Drosophila sechellia]|uniref:GM13255 n=1 Tax=Drosophila sechellia TaxID=7238 RepID=B4ILC1_DROSE|nr:GM13255 [Drosophila sechellia]